MVSGPNEDRRPAVPAFQQLGSQIANSVTCPQRVAAWMVEGSTIMGWMNSVGAGLVVAVGAVGAVSSAHAQTGDDESNKNAASAPASAPSSAASLPAVRAAAMTATVANAGGMPAPGQDALPSVQPAAPPPPADAAAPQSSQDAAASSSQLEEIVVTSQKRRENLQNIPLSVITMDGEKASYLRGSGADIRFLSARVPSLTIESSFGRTFPRFYIRGLGNTDFDLNASQPVSMILDDVVLENPTLKGFPIFDVDRVEVLRGPQGTLFGRNTPAGIIKFQSKAPTMDFEAYGRATYGTFDFIGLEAAASGPIIDDILAVRMSILYERRDGWVTNTFTGEDNALEGFEDVAGRLQLLYTPNDKFRLLMNLHAHTLEGTARLFRANIIQPGTDDFVADFERDEISIDGQNSQSVTQLGFTTNLQYNAGPVTFTAIFGYEGAEIFTRGDIDGGFGAVFAPPSGPGFIPFPSESADGIPELRQYTGEARIATNNWDVVNFQLGSFFFREELVIDSFSFDTLNNGAVNGIAVQNQTTEAFALFASGSVDLLDNLRIAGGLRWSDDSRQFSASRSLSPIGAGSIGPLTAQPTAEFLSWDISATYGVTQDVNVYGRIARGFRAPSVQGRILFGDSISVAQKEKILSFEGGIKSELFDRRARINLAGFYYELSDQQLTAVGGEANFNTLLNSDKARGSGFELDAQLLPLSNVLITMGLSYNNTEIRDKNLAIVPCGGGCTVTDEPGNVEGTVNINGNPLPHAPEWIFNSTVRLSSPIHEDGEVFVFADLAYRSRINFFLYESEEFTDASLLEIGVRAGYARFDGRLELAFFSRNINNDLSRTGGIDFNNLTGFVNEPRTIGIEGRWQF